MEQTGYLGCDVSKGYCDFILLGASKNVLVSNFCLDDNKQGRDTLSGLIREWQSVGLTNLYCGVESTGGYENNWFRFLRGQDTKDLPIKTARLNPKGVKAVVGGYLTRTITDAVSAANIACYLILFPEKVEYGNPQSAQENKVCAGGRQHHTYIRMLVKQKVQINNQLEKLLYQNFAEILVYCRHGIPNWVLKLLVKYPGAMLIGKAGLSKIVAIKGISKDKGESLLKKTAVSEQVVGKQEGHIISAMAREILLKTDLIAAEKQYLQQQYNDDERVRLLCSIGGIGIDSAIQILLEIEDISRFGTVKKLASYFGVHPTFKQSGDGVWGNHMSKKGRSEIRGVLYMAALTGIRCNPILRRLYARFRARGMKHYEAMGVVMHKLLRMVYGILKTGKVFDVAIDDANIENANVKREALAEALKNAKTETKKKRNRYQTKEVEAPISRRKYQENRKAESVPILVKE